MTTSANDDVDVEFVLRVTAFASRIHSEEHLRNLLICALSIVNERSSNSADDFLQGLEKLAEKHHMLD